MKKLILGFLVVVSTSVNAAPGDWTPSNTINQIIIENGKALILMSGGVPSSYIPSECSNQYNQADLSTGHGKAVYSMALAAKMAEKGVSLALTCSGGRPFISLIRLN